MLQLADLLGASSFHKAQHKFDAFVTQPIWQPCHYRITSVHKDYNINERVVPVEGDLSGDPYLQLVPQFYKAHIGDIEGILPDQPLHL